jgi:hypothetical protein
MSRRLGGCQATGDGSALVNRGAVRGANAAGRTSPWPYQRAAGRQRADAGLVRFRVVTLASSVLGDVVIAAGAGKLS